MFKSQKTSGMAFVPCHLVCVARAGMCETDEPYQVFSPILTSFDKSQKFRAVIYFNFGVLLQEK